MSQNPPVEHRVIYVPVQAPAQQLPTPKELKEQAVASTAKKLKCTSCCLLALGVICVVSALIHGFVAREVAEKIYLHEVHGTKLSDSVSREEFALYDSFKALSFFGLIFSALLLGLGKCGMKLARRQKTQMARRLTCKSRIAAVVLVIVGLILTHYAHDIDKTIFHIQKQHKTEAAQPVTASGDPEDCSSFGEDSCDGQSACTWCLSAAVPSACYTLDDAKGLPPAVFSCDKLKFFEEVSDSQSQVAEPFRANDFDQAPEKIYKDDEEMCDDSYTSESDCDGNSKCTWCKCSAVPSACHSWSTAKALPQSVFQCDGVSNEPETLMRALVPGVCKNQDSQETCEESGCSWCESAAVGNSCFDNDDASHLPKSIFTCLSSQEEDATKGFLGPLFLAILTISQLYLIKSMKTALEDLDEVNGIPKPQSGCCSWKKRQECCAAPQAARPAPPQAAPINESFDYSVDEPAPVAQAPPPERVQNSMV